MSPMTPKQRFLVTIQGGKPDRLPTFVGTHSGVLHHYYGLPPRSQVEDAESVAAAIARFATEFEYGSISPYGGYINLGCGPELGVSWDFPEDGLPSAVDGVINGLTDVEKLQVPQAPSGYFRTYLETLGRVQELAGETTNVSGLVLGPFSIACFLRGVENVLLDLKLNQELFHAYMPRCVALSRYFGDWISKVGIFASLNEVFLSPELLSARAYHTLIAPYDRQVTGYFSAHGITLNCPMSAFMGAEGDPASQRAGRMCYYAMFGTRESLEVIREAAPNPPPGLGNVIGLSGRMLLSWPPEEVLSFLRQAVDFHVRERGVYPTIYTAGVQPFDRASALDVAGKLHAINGFLERYTL